MGSYSNPRSGVGSADRNWKNHRFEWFDPYGKLTSLAIHSARSYTSKPAPGLGLLTNVSMRLCGTTIRRMASTMLFFEVVSGGSMSATMPVRSARSGM